MPSSSPRARVAAGDALVRRRWAVEPRGIATRLTTTILSAGRTGDFMRPQIATMGPGTDEGGWISNLPAEAGESRHLCTHHWRVMISSSARSPADPMRSCARRLAAPGDACELNDAKPAGWQDAVAAMRTQHVDIVIIDFAMAPMGGIEFARLLRNSLDSPNPLASLIMTTGHSTNTVWRTRATRGLTKSFPSR